jgi:uncharacterized protein
MIPFKTIDLEDRIWIDPLLSVEQIPSEEYSFTYSYIWRIPYHLKVAQLNGFYLLLADRLDNQSYLFPTGQGDLKSVIESLRGDAALRGVKLHFHTLLGAQKEKLEALFPGEFAFTELRDYSDYIYDTQSLATLAGKKLHGKRNHINRFMENNPDWAYEPITTDNIGECRAMTNLWCLQVDCEDDEDLKKEACAIKQALENFETLRFSGGVLRVNREIIAYTIGDRLTDEIFMVHIEKAFSDIQGAYPMINQQFVLANCMNYPFVDRQDDMGVPGLRQAKLTYQPVRIVDKYMAVDIKP